jgi:hypothetical protein
MSDSRRFVEGEMGNGGGQCWINLDHCEVVTPTVLVDRRLERCMEDNGMEYIRYYERR